MDSAQPTRSSIHIPAYLTRRRLPMYNQNPLSILQERYGIQLFGDIKEDLLRVCYQTDRILFWRVINQLAFFGVTFDSDALRSYTIVSSPELATFFLCPVEDWDRLLDIPGESPVRNQLLEFGIRTFGCLVGVPSESVRRLSGGATLLHFFHSIGFQSVGLRELEKTLGVESTFPDEGTVGDPPQSEEGAIQPYPLPDELLYMELTEAEWPDCKGVVRILREKGLRQLGQLPADLEGFLSGLWSVGTRKTQNFKRRLDALVSVANRRATRAGAKSMTSLDELHAEFVEGGLTHKELTERLRSVSLEDIQVLAEMAACINVHARRIAFPTLVDKALLLSLSRPQSVPGDDLLAAVKIIPQNWLQELHRIVDSLLISPEQRLSQEMEPFWNLIRRLSAGGQPDTINDSQWLLFNRKIDNWMTGHYPTLREMGEWLGVTRERARQLELKMERVLEGHGERIKALKKYVGLHRGFVHSAIIFPDDLSHRGWVIAQELLGRKEIVVRDGLLMILSDVKFERRVIKPAQEALSGSLGPTFTASALEAAVRAYVTNKRYHPSVVPALSQTLLDKHCTSYGERWGWRGVSKTAIAVSVFREYPEGFALYKDVDEFRDRLESMVPGLFETDRALIASVTGSDDVLLWGWGVYIHRDHIKVAPSVIKAVADWIHGQLRRGIPQMVANAAFAEFEEELLAAGVPNEHALYTCLRLFHPDRFFLPKAPKIFPAGQSRNYRYTEILEQFLEDGPKAAGELREEFVSRAGWKESMLQQTLGLSDRIIRSGPSEYALLSHFPVSQRQLEPLAGFLEFKLGQGLETVSVTAAIKEREAYCYKLGIQTPQLLYDLLQAYFANRLSFLRYPHLARPQSMNRQDVSHRKLMASYLLDRRDIVTKEELRYEFMERRGWTQRALDNSLSYNPDILAYTRGVVMEYVHRDAIGWDEEKAALLTTYLEGKFEEIRERNFPFATVRELMDHNRLPKLEGDIDWTEDLLQALMEEMESVLMLGTKRSLFVPLPNPLGIEENVDFVTYILAEEFGGATQRSLLETRLIKLDFCKEIPDGLLTSEDLPYRLLGNEIILKEL